MVTKVVDDLLITGDDDYVQHFVKDIRQSFSLGRVIDDNDMIFNKLHTKSNSNFDISFSMNEDLYAIKPLKLPKTRRKEFPAPCDDEEL